MDSTILIQYEHVTESPDSGDMNGIMPDYGLMASGHSRDEVIADLKQQLRDYANEVVSDLDYYQSDSKRMKQLPELCMFHMFPHLLDTMIEVKLSPIS